MIITATIAGTIASSNTLSSLSSTTVAFTEGLSGIDVVTVSIGTSVIVVTTLLVDGSREVDTITIPVVGKVDTVLVIRVLMMLVVATQNRTQDNRIYIPNDTKG